MKHLYTTFLVAVCVLSVSSSASFAQSGSVEMVDITEGGAAKNSAVSSESSSGYETAQPTQAEGIWSNGGLNVTVPTGVRFGAKPLFKSIDTKAIMGNAEGVHYELDHNDLEVELGASGRARYSGGTEDTPDAWDGDIKLFAGVKFANLSADVQFNFEQDLVEELTDVAAAQGEKLINEGLVRRRAKQLLEKLLFTVRLGRIADGSGNTIVEVAGTFGRGSATPIMHYVYSHRPGVSPLVVQEIDQVDMVAVDVKVLNNTLVRAAFLLDVFGHPNDDSNIDQGDGSWTLSIEQWHDLANQADKEAGVEKRLSYFFAYADTEEDFINLNRSLLRQTGAGDLFALGGKLRYGKLEFGVTGVYRDLDEMTGAMDDDEELFIEAYGSVDVTERVILALVYNYIDSAFDDEDGHMVSAFVEYLLMNNVKLQGGISWVSPDEGDDYFMAQAQIAIDVGVVDFNEGRTYAGKRASKAQKRLAGMTIE